MKGKGNSLWVKGVSGNPAGRPKGALNNTTMAAMAFLEGSAEGVIRKCVQMAEAGDTAAIKLVVERLIPAKKYVELAGEGGGPIKHSIKIGYVDD